MSVTYEIIEDAPGDRFKVIKKVSGVQQSGKWWAKGSALLNVNATEVILTAGAGSSIKGRPQTQTIPFVLLAVPAVSGPQNAFDLIRPIIF